MKARTRLAALATAGLVAAVPLIGTANSENKTTSPVAAAPAEAAQKTQILRTSDNIIHALNSASAARIAIFNAEPDKAMDSVTELVENLDTVRAEAGSLTVDAGQPSKSGEFYLPFQTSLSMAEGFTPTDDDMVVLTEASAYLAMGDEKKAAEMLEDAGIDVTLNAALLPLNASVEHAARAKKHIADGAYYKANLALKAIVDGALLDSYAIDSVPSQGMAG